MGEMITKPDANPILYAVLNFILCGLPVGHFVMGQSQKAIVLCVYWVIITILSAGTLQVVWAILCVLDAYQLGQRLQAGESIGLKENGFGLFDSLPGLK